MAKFDWGRFAQSAGGSMQGYFADQMQRQQRQADIADERAWREEQAALAQERSLERMQAEIDARNQGRIDFLNQTDPYMDETALLGSSGGVDYGAMTGAPGFAQLPSFSPQVAGMGDALSGMQGGDAATQFAMGLAQAGAPLRRSELLGMVGPRGSMTDRTKTPPPETLGDAQLIDSVVTPAERFAFGEQYEPAVLNQMGQLFAEGYPNDVATAQLAEDMVRQGGGFAPYFGPQDAERGRYQFQPEMGSFYDPTIAEFQPYEQKRFWRDQQAEFKVAPGATQKQMDTYPPISAADYANAYVLPAVRTGQFKAADVRAWGKENNAPQKVIDAMIAAIPKPGDDQPDW